MVSSLREVISEIQKSNAESSPAEIGNFVADEIEELLPHILLPIRIGSSYLVRKKLIELQRKHLGEKPFRFASESEETRLVDDIVRWRLFLKRDFEAASIGVFGRGYLHDGYDFRPMGLSRSSFPSHPVETDTPTSPLKLPSLPEPYGVTGRFERPPFSGFRVPVLLEAEFERQIVKDRLFEVLFGAVERCLRKFFENGRFKVDEVRCLYESDVELPAWKRAVLTIKVQGLSFEEKLKLWEEIDAKVSGAISELAASLSSEEDRSRVGELSYNLFIQMEL